MNAWQVCWECGDDWCNIHRQHVKDCPCPMHHEWPQDPLTSKIGKETTTPPPRGNNHERERDDTMSKVLSNLAKQHPDKIYSIERDDTGWIINLTDDWVECSDPLQPSHMIFEDTVSECVSAFRGIKPSAVAGL